MPHVLCVVLCLGTLAGSKTPLVNGGQLKNSQASAYIYTCDTSGNCGGLNVSWFWPDQIGIDQANTAERNYQVKFMKVISTGAYVWFTKAREDGLESRKALDALFVDKVYAPLSWMY